jgi:hypothetical protein
MQIYKNLITVENLEEFNLIFGSTNPNALPEKIKKVCTYLREGYKYAANVKDDSVIQMDITAHTDLVHTLHQCTSDMASDKGTGIYIALDCGAQVNMGPLFDFLDSMDSMEDTVDNLEELERVLENYLNETNIKEYKECKYVIGQITEWMKYLQKQSHDI